MEVARKLEEETRKWQARIKKERRKIILKDKAHENFLANIDNYISDCAHFAKKDMQIEAFEAVIWAWAYLEIGLDIGILQKIRKA